MTRLPTVGADSNTWGTILNAFLSVAHNADGSITNLFFNVKDPAYGAKGDGVTDDTAAIQNAITAAQNAGGGMVFFPATANSYLISSTLTVSADNIELVGASWGAQIKASGAITGNMLQVQGPGGAGNFRYGIRIANLFFNGNNIASLNGLDMVSCYAAVIEHVRIRFVAGISIHFDGISGAFGAYNYLIDSHITDGGSTAIGLQTDNSEWLTVQGCEFGFFSGGTGVGIKLQNLNNRIIGTSFDHNDTSVQVSFTHRNIISGCQFDRGSTRFIYLQSGANNIISDNLFCTSSGGTDVIRADGNNNDRNIIANNTCTASTWTNFVNEIAGIGGTNQYIGNFTAGYAIARQSGIFRNNPGYNPVVLLPAPVAPGLATATTGGTVAAGTYQVEVTYTNSFGETVASASASIVTTGTTSTITITSPTAIGNAVSWYAYVTQAGGVTYTRQQTAGSPTLLGTNLVLIAPPTNTGANPPGANTTGGVTTPAVPATTVAQKNTTGVDCMVLVTGGTVSAIAIGGTTTGLTSGTFRLIANETITLTYTVAPTWVWIGE